jgi:hypothetical protein
MFVCLNLKLLDEVKLLKFAGVEAIGFGVRALIFK